MKNLLFRLLGISLVLFLVFVLDITIGDITLFLLVNKKFSSQILDFVFLYIVVPLLLFLVIVPGLMLFFRRYRAVGVLSILFGGLSYLFGGLIKFSPRPSQILSQIRLVGDWMVGNNSFPSTTTMLAFGLALPLYLLEPKIGRFSLLLAFLAGFFVVYSGYHFPEDAIAGAGICVAIVLPFVFIKKKLDELQ